MKNMIIGIMAGLFCTISFIPQVIKIFKTKNTRDLSLMTFSMLSLGVLLWFIYGILIKEPPIIGSNAVILILSLLIVVMKIRYD